jgi:hypothetical protein
VKGLFVYEPPFIVDDSRPPCPKTFQSNHRTGSAGRRNDAVKALHEGIGHSSFRCDHDARIYAWMVKMEGLAHTLPYDLAVMEGTQMGKPLPAERWTSVSTPTLVMQGRRASHFFTAAAGR